MGMQQYDEDVKAEGKRVFNEFDCPTCSANNPYDDGFSAGDEVRCFYCGAEFKVRLADGKLRYKEI